MAESRRDPGALREALLRLLESASWPLSALEMRAAVNLEGEHLAPSFVSRAIRELLEQRQIRRLVSARGYAAGQGNRTISLLCGRCGVMTGLVAEVLLERLRAVAVGHRFTPSEFSVELTGRCERCARKQGRPETPERKGGGRLVLRRHSAGASGGPPVPGARSLHQR